MLLAIDTSTGTSVAIIDTGGVLAERTEHGTRRHAEAVGTLIAEALRDAGTAPRELSGVAVGIGPGPFTGLRVGIAAARAFAAGTRRPVLPVPSHDAVAYAHALEGRRGPLVVVTDARRRELAWSAYDEPDELGLPVRIAGPELAPAADLDAALERRLGDGALAASEARQGARVEASAIPAGALGMLARALSEHGRRFGDDRPIYLRAPDVTLSAGPKRVTP